MLDLSVENKQLEGQGKDLGFFLHSQIDKLISVIHQSTNVNGLENKTLFLLTGEEGVGKTSALYGVEKYSNADVITIKLLDLTNVSRREELLSVVAGLVISDAQDEEHHVGEIIEALEIFAENNNNLLLVLDNADQIDDELIAVLLELNVVTNDRVKLLFSSMNDLRKHEDLMSLFDVLQLRTNLLKLEVLNKHDSMAYIEYLKSQDNELQDINRETSEKLYTITKGNIKQLYKGIYDIDLQDLALQNDAPDLLDDGAPEEELVESDNYTEESAENFEEREVEEYGESSQAMLANADPHNGNESEGDPVENNEQGQNWYQMIPIFHMLVVVVLGVVLLLLFFFDTDKTEMKSEELILPLETTVKKNNSTEQQEKSAVDASDKKFSSKAFSLDRDVVALKKKEQLGHKEADEEKAVKSKAEIEGKPKSKVKVKAKPVVQEKIKVPEPIKKPVKPAKIKPQAEKAKVERVDWTPYQSTAWIKRQGVNTYTLQVMASYDAAGIKNFLKANGVNSNYAVYTSEKSGKAWHVIIYGTFKDYSQAQQARDDLPESLRVRKPWIRKMADVKKSIR